MLTVKQIKARATSLREALLVSIEEWTWRAQATEKELKQVALTTDKCGLCHYYGFAHGSGHGDCPLHDVPERACCLEYNVADDALEEWQDENGNLAEVRAVFWQMVARLDSELAKLPEEKKEEPKLRHGDYGYSDSTNYPRVYLKYESGKVVLGRTAHAFEFLPRSTDLPNIVLGNIFDDLAAMQEDVEEYEKTVEGGHTLRLKQRPYSYDGAIEFNIGGQLATATIPETEEIILWLRQAVAQLKRKQLCKENKKCGKQF